MTVTFKPVVVPGNRRKDGTSTVYIRITFKGVCRRIPTTMAATQADLTRTGRIKNADILEKAGELIAQMRDALRDVSPFELEAWDVDRVVGRIRTGMAAHTFRLDFFEWADGYLAASKTGTTRQTYVQALGALERYLGERRLDINDITRGLLLGFVDHVNAEPKMRANWKTGKRDETGKAKLPGAAAARHMMKLGHIFQKAKERYNDEDAGVILIPRSPFDGVKVKTPPSQGGQVSIGFDTMQRVILAQTDDPKTRQALDAFILSFCLMGVNLADMWAAAPPVRGVWEFNRQKTRKRRVDGAYMRMTVPSQAETFIARLGGKDECSGGVWLPVLRTIGSKKDICTSKINARLKEWAEAAGVPTFTFGASRHTWTTLARGKAGVEKATVDECLVHVGDFPVTDIYAERSWELFDEANAKVLALFQWPG